MGDRADLVEGTQPEPMATTVAWLLVPTSVAFLLIAALIYA